MKKPEGQMFKYEPVHSYSKYIPFPPKQPERGNWVSFSGIEANHGESVLYSPQELTEWGPNGHCRHQCIFFKNLMIVVVWKS